jgi:hypothetical protein
VFALVRGDPALLGRWQIVGYDLEQFAQRALDPFRFGQAALALLAENLALKPGHLAAQVDDFAILHIEQFGHIHSAQCHRRVDNFSGGFLVELHIIIIKFLQGE